MPGIQGFLQTSGLLTVLLMVIFLWRSVNTTPTCNLFGYYCHNATHYINCRHDGGGRGDVLDEPQACPFAGLCADNLPTRCQSAHTDCGTQAHFCLDAKSFQLCVETSVGTMLRMGDVQHCNPRMRCSDDAPAICVDASGTTSASTATTERIQLHACDPFGFYCVNSTHFVSCEGNTKSIPERCPSKQICSETHSSRCVDEFSVACGPMGHVCLNATHFETCVEDEYGNFHATGQVDVCPLGSGCNEHIQTICNFLDNSTVTTDFMSNSYSAVANTHPILTSHANTELKETELQNRSWETSKTGEQRSDHNITNLTNITDKNNIQNVYKNSSNFQIPDLYPMQRNSRNFSLEANNSYIVNANISIWSRNIETGPKNASIKGQSLHSHKNISHGSEKLPIVTRHGKYETHKTPNNKSSESAEYFEVLKDFKGRSTNISEESLTKNSTSSKPITVQEYEVDEIWTTDGERRHYHSQVTIRKKKMTIIIHSKNLNIAEQGRNSSTYKDVHKEETYFQNYTESETEATEAKTLPFAYQKKDTTNTTVRTPSKTDSYNDTQSSINKFQNDPNTNTTKIEVPDNNNRIKCTNEGKFPDPNGNASMYYCCLPKGADYVILPLSCPQRSQFELKSRNCVTQDVMDVKYNLENNTNSCTEPGKFPSPSGNCSQFYVCMAFGKLYIMREFLCPSGSEFNYNERRCTVPEKANCSIARYTFQNEVVHTSRYNLTLPNQPTATNALTLRPLNYNENNTVESSSDITTEIIYASSSHTNMEKVHMYTLPQSVSNDDANKKSTQLNNFGSSSHPIVPNASQYGPNFHLLLTEENTVFESKTPATAIIETTNEMDINTTPRFIKYDTTTGNIIQEGSVIHTHRLVTATTGSSTIPTSINSFDSSKGSSLPSSIVELREKITSDDVFTTTTGSGMVATTNGDTFTLTIAGADHTTVNLTGTEDMTTSTANTVSPAGDKTISAPTSDAMTILVSTTDDMTMSASTTDDRTIPYSTTDSTTILASTTDDTNIPASTTDDTTMPTSTTDDVSISASTSDDMIMPVSTGGDTNISNYTTDDTTMPVFTTGDMTNSASTADDMTMSGSTTDDTTIPASTIDDITISASTTDHTVMPISTTDDMIIPDSTINDMIMPDSTIDDTTMSASIADYKTIASFTTDHMNNSAGTAGGTSMVPMRTTIAETVTSKSSLSDYGTTTTAYTGMDNTATVYSLADDTQTLDFTTHNTKRLSNTSTGDEDEMFVTTDNTTIPSFAFDDNMTTPTTVYTATRDRTSVDYTTTIQQEFDDRFTLGSGLFEESTGVLPTLDDGTKESSTTTTDVITVTTPENDETTSAISPTDRTIMEVSTTEAGVSTEHSTRNDTTTFHFTTADTTMAHSTVDDMTVLTTTRDDDTLSSLSETADDTTKRYINARDNINTTVGYVPLHDSTVLVSTSSDTTMPDITTANGMASETSTPVDITTTDFYVADTMIWVPVTAGHAILEPSSTSDAAKVYLTVNNALATESYDVTEVPTSGDVLSHFTTKVSATATAPTADHHDTKTEQSTTSDKITIIHNEMNDTSSIISGDASNASAIPLSTPDYETTIVTAGTSGTSGAFYSPDQIPISTTSVRSYKTMIQDAVSKNADVMDTATTATKETLTENNYSTESVFSRNHVINKQSNNSTDQFGTEQDFSHLRIPSIQTTSTSMPFPPPFRCTVSGKFPNKYNSTTYYVCSPLFNGGLKGMLFSCPENSEFYETLGQCAAVQWISGTKTTSAGKARLVRRSIQSTPPFQCTRSGRFPDSWSCSLYHICTRLENGNLAQFTLECPFGNSFDSHGEKCRSDFSCGEIVHIHGDGDHRI